MKKCPVCQFEEDDKKPTWERKEFVILRGSFGADRGQDRMADVTLWVCPECGTVQVHEYWIHT